ncbi:hypothetical protein LMANV2_280086 [Leptospira interrogans serovar Manilae]|uniref:Uncharacterized protein n=1 Tax=Leptospira interrogans serovar Manilae TaxID=214675 RepID=A0AAQ1NXI8_LEPIR|nr:hypothetical protein LMANV2_280086 [Leptospira interrogans serovar Manilae]
MLISIKLNTVNFITKHCFGAKTVYLNFTFNKLNILRVIYIIVILEHLSTQNF